MSEKDTARNDSGTLKGQRWNEIVDSLENDNLPNTLVVTNVSANNSGGIRAADVATKADTLNSEVNR